jgi:hypothetical protein
MQATDKELLLDEIRQAEGRQASANPVRALIRRWLDCEDAQTAGNALARALSFQGDGEPVFPGAGIWPIPPA